MFWNLVVNKYEEYHLSHLFMLLVLALYSLLGAVCFCVIEAPNELNSLRLKMENVAVKSSLARDRLLYDLQYFFVKEVNVSRLLSRELNTTLDYYDRLMGFSGQETALGKQTSKWTIWGGLYFAGTVYTTIGYGDIVTETIAGKLFTVLYALVGIPLVVTVLNVWGGGLYQLTRFIWKDCIHRLIPHFSPSKRAGKRIPKFIIECEEEDIEDQQFIVGRANSDSQTSEERRLEEEESTKIPLTCAIVVLLLWIFVCAAIFCFLQNWTFFQAAYFFFISLTTIGLGDTTAEHKMACMCFLLILIGLSVVSMSINIIQMEIEGIFSKIIRSIDNDFKKNLAAEKRKHSMATSIGEQRKTSANTVAVSVPNQKDTEAIEEDGGDDAVQKYSKDMALSDRFLTRLMSSHQRRLLNQKMTDRQKMRNIDTQTEERKMTSAAQTDQVARTDILHSLSQQEDSSSEEEEDFPASSLRGSPPKNQQIAGTRVEGMANFLSATGAPKTRHHKPRGLSRKKLYIYNIGD